MRKTTSIRTTAISLVVALVASLAVLAAPAGAAPPASAPANLAPSGGSYPANQPLTWDPVADAVRYRVQVSNSNSYATILWQIDTYNTTATPPNDLPVGDVFWRVAGISATNEIGPYGAATFAKTQGAGPTLSSPVDGEQLEFPDEPVVLSWQPTPFAASYKVEVDDAPDFIGAQTYTTDGTSLALTEPQAVDQTYYWRVQGVSSTTGVNTDFSETRSYDVTWSDSGVDLKPSLLSPISGASVIDTTFRWTAVKGAATYRIQVSSNPDFTNNVVIDQVVKGTSYARKETLNNASYFWRVRAIDAKAGSSNLGPWSSTETFTRSWIDTPTLLSPADNDQNVDNILLRWTPVPQASHYRIEVGTDANFSPGTYWGCHTNHTDWSPSKIVKAIPLNPTFIPETCENDEVNEPMAQRIRLGLPVYWRVRGQDKPTNTVGPWSTVRSFAFNAGVPTNLSPAPGATVAIPRLSWDPVPGAGRYRVRLSSISRARNYTNLMVSGTSYTPNIDPATDWNWSVEAIDGAGRPGPLVSGGSFNLTGIDPDDTTFTAQTPNGTTTGDLTPEFNWTPYPGAARYQVLMAVQGSDVYEPLVDPNLPVGENRHLPRYSSFSLTTPHTPGNYQWVVRALDNFNAILAQTAPLPFTLEVLDVVSPTAPADCVEGNPCETHTSTPLMTWDRVEWADHYIVHVALDPFYTNEVYTYDTSQLSLRPRLAFLDNQAGQSYYWFVQPCHVNVCGRFDASVFNTDRAFRKSSRPITLTAPLNGATVPDQVTFTWEDYLDSSGGDLEASVYRIQVSTTADFSSILDQQDVDQTSYTPSHMTYPEGPLYWRVQALDASGAGPGLSGNPLTLSEVRQVNKQSPTITGMTPLNSANVGSNPVLEWNAQAYAARYEVEVYKNADTNWTIQNRVVNTITKHTAVVPTVALAPGIYAWRIRRLDVDAKPGPWATATNQKFTVATASPSLIAPADAATFATDSIVTSWTAVPRASKYRFEASVSPDFSTIIETVDTVMTTWAIAKRYPDATIHWRVKALDPRNNVLGTSETRTFVHDMRRPSATITGAFGSVASAVVRWTVNEVGLGGTLTGFKVELYNNVGPTFTKLDEQTVGGTVREYRYTGLTNGTYYRFKVVPVDGAGLGISSPISVPVLPTSTAPFGNQDSLVNRMYLDFYARNATAAEMAYWKSQLTGGKSGADMALTLFTQTSFGGITYDRPFPLVADPVVRLYKAYFLRRPDFSGLQYWLTQGRNGWTRRRVSKFFSQSTEFNNLYGTLTNAQFVNLVYQNVLGRAGDAAGVAYWTNQLNTGRAIRGEVMLGFSESAEYKAKMNGEVKVTLLYHIMLSRMASDAEYMIQVNRINTGTPYKTLVDEVYFGAEYIDRVT